MARAKVEFVHMGEGTIVDGRGINVLQSVVTTLDYITVTDTATAAESRPAAPPPLEGGGAMYARVTAVDGPVIVAWGANPTASATSGVRLCEDQPEMIPVVTGTLLSFVEA
jgi:hypothetical protein